MAQFVHTLAGVAVQGQRAQAFAQGFLQISVKTVRVFHRIELDHTRRILNSVGVHGLHVFADALHQ